MSESKNSKITSFAERKLRHKTSSDIYDAIYEAIIEHHLLPGTKLNESVFSTHFGVSRTIIRTAFSNLAQSNIVELRPNRGAIVACPTIEETHEVFDSRRLIEKNIIQGTIDNMTKQGIKTLRALARQEHTLQKEKNKHQLVRITGEFHILLADFAGNKILKAFVTELVSRTSLIIALYEMPGAPVCAIHDHSELINLIEAKDKKNAAKSMIQHLDEIENRLDLKKKEKEINLTEIFDD